MSTNAVLKGGLGGLGTAAGIIDGVVKSRKKEAINKARRANFLDLDAEIPELDEGSDEEIALIEYLDEYADKAYGWVVEQTPKKRVWQAKIDGLGHEVGEKLVQVGPKKVRIEAVLAQYEQTLARLVGFCPDDDKIVRDFVVGQEDKEDSDEERNAREQVALAACGRVQQMTRLGVLVDGLASAQSKEALEKLLHTATEGGKSIFVQKTDGSIWVFGRRYEIPVGVFDDFPTHREFALEVLTESLKTRSQALAAAHKAEVKQHQTEVLVGDESRVSAEELLFGDSEDTNEKTALLSWQHGKFQNSIVVRRRDKALLVEEVIGAAGKDFRELDEMNADYGVKSVMVMLYNIVDGDKLVAKGEDGKYKFSINAPMSIPENERKAWWLKTLKMTLWVRTAAGGSVPVKRIPEDERVVAPEATKKPAVNGNGTGNGAKTVTVPLADNDGKEAVDPEVFFFRKVNGGAGTVTVSLSEGFLLKLDEVKDEQQEVVAPAREVKLAKPTKVCIRRAIVGGKPKIVLDACDNVEAFEEFRVNGIPGVEWIETCKKGWAGLPNPLPGLLSFRYKQACESGELKPAVRK